MVSVNEERWAHDVVSSRICLTLATLFCSVIVSVGHAVVVDYFQQDEIVFWLAIAIAILVWFIEEMLHLAFPCRHVFRRLAQLWLDHRRRES
jgi:hypothetical protein